MYKILVIKRSNGDTILQAECTDNQSALDHANQMHDVLTQLFNKLDMDITILSPTLPIGILPNNDGVRYFIEIKGTKKHIHTVICTPTDAWGYVGHMQRVIHRLLRWKLNISAYSVKIVLSNPPSRTMPSLLRPVVPEPEPPSSGLSKDEILALQTLSAMCARLLGDKK